MDIKRASTGPSIGFLSYAGYNKEFRPGYEGKGNVVGGGSVGSSHFINDHYYWKLFAQAMISLIREVHSYRPGTK